MKQSRKRTKSVAFSPNVLVYRTTHINDFTDEEIQNAWYNDKEMRDIVSECVDMISSKKTDEEQFCMRGLECRTPQGQKRRTSNRFCTIDAVLEEQEAQWECDEYDVERIRTISRQYTKPSQAEALQFGLEDEKEAMAIHREGESCSLERKRPRGVSYKDQLSPVNMKLQHMKFVVSPNSAMQNNRNIPQYQYSPMGRAK